MKRGEQSLHLLTQTKLTIIFGITCITPDKKEDFSRS